MLFGIGSVFQRQQACEGPTQDPSTSTQCHSPSDGRQCISTSSPSSRFDGAKQMVPPQAQTRSDRQDHMSEPCMKSLSLVLQDYITCHGTARSSLFSASSTRRLSECSLDKSLAHPTRPTCSPIWRATLRRTATSFGQCTPVLPYRAE
jgi:hypothetical protein